MTNAYHLLEALEREGVEYVFCCPGTSEIPLLDALAERGPEKKPHFVLTTDEAISVSMADGYSRATGKVGVAYLHTNVGLANGAAHTYAAQVARSSLVILVGIKPTRTLRSRALTTTPQMIETIAPYTSHAWQNLHASDLIKDVHEAFRKTQLPGAGPAVLAVPQDHLEMEPNEDVVAFPARQVVQQPLDAHLKEAAHELCDARSIVIVAGSDVARGSASSELLRIAEMLDASVMVESRRDLERWTIPTSHPHFVGLFEPNSATVQDASVLLLAGLPSPIEFGPDAPVLPTGTTLIHLSEDAYEAGRRGSPEHVLAGDTRATLVRLQELIEAEKPSSPERARSLEKARARLTEERSGYALAVPESGEGQTLSAATAMRTFADTIGGDGMIVLDAVTSTLPLLRFIQRVEPDTLHATASGSLGWGTGAALGVALATQERVWCVIGDGVLQFGLAAFWTAVDMNLPVTFVVVNNGKYQAVVSGLRRYNGVAHQQGTYPLTDIGGVNAAQLANGFGMQAERVASSSALVSSLSAHLELSPSDGPRLIDVCVNDTLWQ